MVYGRGRGRGCKGRARRGLMQAWRRDWVTRDGTSRASQCASAPVRQCTSVPVCSGQVPTRAFNSTAVEAPKPSGSLSVRQMLRRVIAIASPCHAHARPSQPCPPKPQRGRERARPPPSNIPHPSPIPIIPPASQPAQAHRPTPCPTRNPPSQSPCTASPPVHALVPCLSVCVCVCARAARASLAAGRALS